MHNLHIMIKWITYTSWDVIVILEYIHNPMIRSAPINSHYISLPFSLILQWICLLDPISLFWFRLPKSRLPTCNANIEVYSSHLIWNCLGIAFGLNELINNYFRTWWHFKTRRILFVFNYEDANIGKHVHTSLF